MFRLNWLWLWTTDGAPPVGGTVTIPVMHWHHRRVGGIGARKR